MELKNVPVSSLQLPRSYGINIQPHPKPAAVCSRPLSPAVDRGGGIAIAASIAENKHRQYQHSRFFTCCVVLWVVWHRQEGPQRRDRAGSDRRVVLTSGSARRGINMGQWWLLAADLRAMVVRFWCVFVCVWSMVDPPSTAAVPYFYLANLK